MQRLLQLLYRLRHFSLWLLLECTALFASVQYNAHYKTAFFQLTSAINGYFFSREARIRAFFHLEEENRALLAENAALRARLRSAQYPLSAAVTSVYDSLYGQQYTFIPAQIISTSLYRPNNSILIDRGTAQGVTPNMGVIASRGVVGIVSEVSKNYARVIPVINTYAHTNVRLKRSHFFGFLSWDGKDHRILQLQNIPRYADIQLGDTLVSDNKSALFPAGIPIGTLCEVKADRRNFYSAQVELFLDFARLRSVYVVKNLLREDLQQLDQAGTDE